MINCRPCKTELLGASLGESHLAPIQKAIASQTLPDGEILVFDFEGITAVNASYIKATVLWIHLCGKLDSLKTSVNFPIRHASDPRPFDVYAIVIGLSPEVEEEFIDFFQARKIPLLFGSTLKDGVVRLARLIGHLDGALRITLNAVIKNGSGNAPQLHQDFPDEAITVTAWNNRLSDLHAYRLVRRIRKGKLWEYKPLVERIIYG